MCEDCGTGWPDQTEEEIVSLKARVAELEEQIASRDALLKSMVPWEPRDGWPTREQVKAWAGVGVWVHVANVLVGNWRFRCSDGYMSGDSSATQAIHFSDETFSAIKAVVPFQEGRPVSWSEVDAAVETARKGSR